MAELRNTNFEEWNNDPINGARGKKRHLYYMVNPETHKLLGCQREGCFMNKIPGRWPEIPRCLAQLPNRCGGSRVQGEEGTEKVEWKTIPDELVKAEKK